MQYLSAEKTAKILAGQTIKEATAGTDYNGDYEDKATNSTLTLTLSNGLKVKLTLDDLAEVNF